MTSSSERIIIAVDGGLRRTPEGLTGGASAIIFRIAPITPFTRQRDVTSISVRGEFFDHEESVTNNRMELSSFILGLRTILRELVDQDDGSISIEFWSDSQYAIGMIFRDWSPNTNHDLVKEAKELVDELQDYGDVSGRFIRGHKGHFVNEFADIVATLCYQRQADIDHELKFLGIADTCLLCDNFPCEVLSGNITGIQPIREWKSKFDAIRAEHYGPPCVHRKAYDAESVFRKSPVRVTASEGAGGGN